MPVMSNVLERLSPYAFTTSAGTGIVLASPDSRNRRVTFPSAGARE